MKYTIVVKHTFQKYFTINSDTKVYFINLLTNAK